MLKAAPATRVEDHPPAAATTGTGAKAESNMTEGGRTKRSTLMDRGREKTSV